MVAPHLIRLQNPSHPITIQTIRTLGAAETPATCAAAPSQPRARFLSSSPSSCGGSSSNGDPPLPLHIVHPSPRHQEQRLVQVHRRLLRRAQEAAGGGGGSLRFLLPRGLRQELGVVPAPRPGGGRAVSGDQPGPGASPGGGVGVRRAERRPPRGLVRGGRRRRAEPRDQVRRQAAGPRPRGTQEHPPQLHHRPQAHEQSRRVRVRGPGAGEVVPDDRGGQQQGHHRARHKPEGGRHHRRPRLHQRCRRPDPRRHRLREPPSAGDGREVQRGDLQHGEAAGGGDRRAAGHGRPIGEGEQEGVQLQDQGGDGGEARAVHARRRRAARHRLRRTHGAVLRLRVQEVSRVLACCTVIYYTRRGKVFISHSRVSFSCWRNFLP